MFCNNCGAKLENNNAKFCPKCGKALNKPDLPPVNAGNFINESKPDADGPANPNNPSSNENISAEAGTAGMPDSFNSVNDNGTPDDNLNQSMPNNNKSKKGLFIVLVIIIVIIAAAGGVLFYLNKTGKLNIGKIKRQALSISHIKSSSKSKKSEPSKESKNSNKALTKSSKSNGGSNNTSSNSNTPAAIVPSPAAPAYVYHNNSRPSYSNAGNAFSVFKQSLGSARAYATWISPVSNSSQGNAPAVIISNVIAEGGSAFTGGNITLHSKFYVEVPSNFTSQSVKLTYEITGNGLTAYNNSYINVTKAGIYDAGLSVNIPSNFQAGTYAYTLTVESPATIEESSAAYLKIQ